MESLRTYKAFRIGLVWFAIAALTAAVLVYTAGRGQPDKDVRNFNGVELAAFATSFSAFSHNGTAFVGDIDSGKTPQCVNNKSITVFRDLPIGSGPDLTVGTATTNSTGGFTAAFAPVPGTYYASVAGSDGSGGDTCTAASSGSITI